MPDRFVAAIESGRAVLDSLTLATGIPGLSVAVGVGDEVVWAEGFGFADLEDRVAVTPLSKFRIGSVSKPVSSIAVGRLVQQGRLDLDAPDTQTVTYPGSPRSAGRSRRDSSPDIWLGIRHYRGAEFEGVRHYETVGEGLHDLRGRLPVVRARDAVELLELRVESRQRGRRGAADIPFLAYMRRGCSSPLASLTWCPTRSPA